MAKLKALNICLVSSDYLPNIGGVASHVHGLALALSDLGHNVTLVTTQKAPKINNISVITVPVRDQKIVRDLHFAVRMANRNKGIFDVVHWHGLWGDSLVGTHISNGTKRLKVFTNHTSMFLAKSKNPFWRQFFKWWLSFPDLIICPSQEILKVTKGIVFDKRVVFIPNGVDPEMFKPAGHRPSSTSKKVILAPRRLVEKNGLIYLIRALPRVLMKVDVELILAGSGPDLERLRNEAQNLGVSQSVRFYGAVANDEMPNLYNRADVVAIPSLVEATSVAALEAASSGVPVVASRVGGLPTIVEHERTGFLVEPKDPVALANALVAVLSDPRTHRRFAEEARRKTEREFSWHKIAERTLDLYLDGLNRGT